MYVLNALCSQRVKLNSYSNASVFYRFVACAFPFFEVKSVLPIDRYQNATSKEISLHIGVEKSSTSRAIHARDTGIYWSSENALHEGFIASSGVGVHLNENAKAQSDKKEKKKKKKKKKKKRYRSSMNSALCSESVRTLSKPYTLLLWDTQKTKPSIWQHWRTNFVERASYNTDLNTWIAGSHIYKTVFFLE